MKSNINRIIWTSTASKDWLSIFEYISERNLEAAQDLQATMQEKTAQLLLFPNMCQKGRVKNTREMLIHSHYILIYTIQNENIYILRALHTAQQWP